MEYKIAPLGHQAAMFRLRIAVAAMQNILHATSEAARPGALAAARADLRAALEIGRGTRMCLPETLTDGWTDVEKQEAARILPLSGS